MNFSADLTVFVPSRGRSRKFMEFVDNFELTKRANTKLVIVVDVDDQEYAKYLSHQSVEFYTAPKTERGMVGALNAAFHDYDEENLLGFAVGFMGDDHRPRTFGWDERYLESLRTLGSGFVYGDDLYQRDRMPTQVAMTTDIPRILGWMSPPELHHLNVDLVWLDLGRELSRIEYLSDVVVEHMHPLAGKAKTDKGYAAVNSPQVGSHDSAVYENYKRNRLAADVAKINEALS